jgi:hypothetical protein
MTAAMPAPLRPQAPSHLISQTGTNSSSVVTLLGEVQSTMKSAKTCDLIADPFPKSIVCSDNSVAHLAIPDEASLLSLGMVWFQTDFNGLVFLIGVSWFGE